MRLKLGRPDLTDYAGSFDAPAAGPDAPLTVTWAGVTTLLIDDGTSAVMTDGFFSRPGLLEVVLRQLSPSAPRIDGCLSRLGVDRLRRCCRCTRTSTTQWTRQLSLNEQAHAWSGGRPRCRSAVGRACPATVSLSSPRASR